MQEWTATETLLYFNSHPHIEDDFLRVPERWHL